MATYAAAKQLVWLITGTSAGFGRELVHAALRRGDLVIASARDPSKNADIPASENLRVLQLDVTDKRDTVLERVKEAHGLWGRIDVLVNNAGRGWRATVEEGKTETFRMSMDTNFFSMVEVTQAVLPYMRTKRSGTIVNMGSRSDWRADIPLLGPYSATKAAIRAYSETLYSEMQAAKIPIRVLVLEPAAFLTKGVTGYNSEHDEPLNKIDEYDPIREEAHNRWLNLKNKGQEGGAKGDPTKAMELVVDVIRGEGKAAGKEFPLYLPLGELADAHIRAKIKIRLDNLDEWGSVIRDLNFDQ